MQLIRLILKENPTTTPYLEWPDQKYGDRVLSLFIGPKCYIYWIFVSPFSASEVFHLFRNSFDREEKHNAYEERLVHMNSSDYEEISSPSYLSLSPRANMRHQQIQSRLTQPIQSTPVIIKPKFRPTD